MHPSRAKFQTPDALSEHSEQEDAAVLFEASQNAHSIVFVPLWDFQKDKWLAAAFGWTTNRIRILDVGDLDYLSAFSNSIMAEVFRLEASALSRAKSGFMSSVSHELRSPLHGILAGTELLRESKDKALESSLLDTVESCGNMLLDTIDHLLDFAK
jgi:signal transduction histidine kinase